MANNNLYKVSCYSDCGSYFASYLQSALIVANSEAEAIEIAVNEKLDFINKDSTKWEVYLISDNLNSSGVVDTFSDSDY